MKTFVIAALFATLPLATSMVAAAEASPMPNAVAGEKLDSGLGELPHYRLWADATGKNVVAKAAPAANKQPIAAAPSAPLQSTAVAALK